MKKNLLTVLVLALVIVNIVLTTIMMVSVIGVNRKTAELVGNISTALNLELTVPGSEEDAEQVVSLADTETYVLPESMMIPVNSADGKSGYIIFDLSLSMNKKGDGYKEYGTKISEAAYDSMIADTVNSVVGAHTQEEWQSNYEPIREEILQAIQKMFDSTKFIYKVNISGVKFS